MILVSRLQPRAARSDDCRLPYALGRGTVPGPLAETHTPVDDEMHDHTSIMATLRELFDFDETLTDRDAGATGIAHLLTRAEARTPAPLPPLPATRAAELGPAEWAEGVAPDGTIVLNDLQQQLVNLVRRIEEATPPPPGSAGLTSNRRQSLRSRPAH